MYRVGEINQYTDGYAIVFFKKENIVSDWLPILYPFTIGSKQIWPLNIGTQVHCLMDQYCEEGCIIGAAYNDVDTPPSETNKCVTEIASGVRVEVDSTFGLSKGSDTLKDALTLLIEAVQQIMVIYGNNPDFSKLSQAQTKVNNLLS